MVSHKTVSVEECGRQVALMARRTALLHYFFSQTIINRLGEEEGKKIIRDAIWAYGNYCGKSVKAKVEEMGLPLTEENYDKAPDLPQYGWETASITLEDGEVRPIATYCPIAASIKELGPQAEKIGRLYCVVDQAKYHAYNPDIEFIHTKNILDGDPYCEFLVRNVDEKDKG
jgi:L-2-amino-thiazoline-4-carboxylic acid hydrolase